MTVVFKLGGSLLTLPDLVDKVNHVLAQRSDRRCLIFPGGGAVADVVRQWTDVYQLDNEAAHWIAISSLDLNRQLLQHLFHWKAVSDLAEAEKRWSSDASPLLLDVGEFIRAQELRSEPIPHDWTVTSDSLAAWTALHWQADELILLKSIPAPSALTVAEASQQQFVDEYFPRIATSIGQISWCDLRAANPKIVYWLADSAGTDLHKAH